MGEDRSANARRCQRGRINKQRTCVQALHDAESAEAKVFPENREVTIKESPRPTEFREQEDDSLANDQQSVEDSPKGTRRLIGYGAASEVD